MTRRTPPEKRCPQCEIHQNLCFCSFVEAIDTQTEVCVVMHVRERALTSNTARLAGRVLARLQIRTYGAMGAVESEEAYRQSRANRAAAIARASTGSSTEAPVRVPGFLPGEMPDFSDILARVDRRVAVLFPSEDSVELSPEWRAADPRPLLLIVPDGNWKQAGKITRRLSQLAEVPRVHIPLEGASSYRLRHTDREGGLSTYEAIARAVALAEGDFTIRERMEKLFDVMVERRLLLRGKLHPSKLKYGDGGWGKF